MIQDDKQPDIIENDNPLASFESLETPRKNVKRRRFTRNTRMLIALISTLSVLAIVTAIVLPILKKPSTQDEQQGQQEPSSSSEAENPTEAYPLYDHSGDTPEANNKIVQSITIDYDNDRYDIYYDAKQGIYLLRGYEDLQLGSIIDQLIDCSTKLNAYDYVENVTSMADFGLEAPSSTVAVTYHNGTVRTLCLGNTTPDEEGYYARLAEDDRVYMLDFSTASLFMQKKNALVETTLLAPPTVRQNDENGQAVLKQLTLTGGPGGKTLSLRQAEAGDGTDYSYAPMVVTIPYTRMVDELLADTLSSYTYVIASEATVLHPTAADLKTYGFDTPYATAKVTLAIQTIADENDDNDNLQMQYYNAFESTIVVGKKDENGNYYVRVNNNNAIYFVRSSMLSPLIERTYENTISELLFLKNISSIGRLDVNLNGTNHTISITHDESKDERDEQLIAMYNGARLSTPDFRRLYSQLMGLSRYGAASETPSEQAIYHIDLTMTDGTTFLSLDFYQHNASLYLVRTTEGELFTLKAASLDNWLKQFNNFISGKTVADI